MNFILFTNQQLPKCNNSVELSLNVTLRSHQTQFVAITNWEEYYIQLEILNTKIALRLKSFKPFQF